MAILSVFFLIFDHSVTQLSMGLWQVLIPIADTGEFPVNLAAIKMMTKVVEKLSQEEADQCLPDLIPKLVKVRMV